MNFGTVLILLVSVLMLIYLGVALLKPEKF